MNTESFPEPIEDFESLANWFVELGSHFSPAECHGALIGAFSGGMRLADKAWLGFISSVMGLESEELISEHERRAAQLAGQQFKRLEDNDLGFQLFLPDDDVGIQLRTESLGAWCKGFLGGFAEAQLYRRQIGLPLPEKYPENVEEGIRDLTEIAKATYASSKDNDSDVESEVQQFDPLMSSEEAFDDSQGSEVEERDYFEICEYVRLAVLTIFTEFGWVEVLDAQPSGGKGPDAASPRVIH